MRVEALARKIEKQRLSEIPKTIQEDMESTRGKSRTMAATLIQMHEVAKRNTRSQEREK